MLVWALVLLYVGVGVGVDVDIRVDVGVGVGDGVGVCVAAAAAAADAAVAGTVAVTFCNSVIGHCCCCNGRGSKTMSTCSIHPMIVIFAEDAKVLDRSSARTISISICNSSHSTRNISGRYGWYK